MDEREPSLYELRVMLQELLPKKLSEAISEDHALKACINKRYAKAIRGTSGCGSILKLSAPRVRWAVIYRLTCMRLEGYLSNNAVS